MDYNCAEDPKYEPEKQCCGYIVAIYAAFLSLLFALTGIARLIFLPRFAVVTEICSVIGGGLCATFYILILHRPNYIGGNPKFIRLWPFLIGYFLLCVDFCMSDPFEQRLTLMKRVIGFVVFYVIGVVVAYYSFIKDDSSDSGCCMCFKPWVYRRKAFVSEGNGYPFYGAPVSQVYAPHGYPSSYAQPAQFQPQMRYDQQQQFQMNYQNNVVPQTQVHNPHVYAQHTDSSVSIPNEAPPQYQEATQTTSSYGYYGPKS